MRKTTVLAVLLAISTVTTAGRPLDASADLDARLSALAAKSGFPGFAVAVVTRDGVAFHKAYGFADLATKRPYTTATVQPVGSISKTVIGVSVMKAVELGYFTLDTNVSDVVPFRVSNPRFPDRPITIRQLATHTSGIVDAEATYEKAYTRAAKPDMALGDFLAAYLDPKGKLYAPDNYGKAEPGAEFRYTNIGAALAAYAVEVKAGVPFSEFSKKVVLAPVGMRDSGWSYDAIDASRHAVLYDGKRKPYPQYTLVTYPEGGLRTTCDDLSAYLVEVLRGAPALLSEASVREMLRPQFADGKAPRGVSEKEPNEGIFWQFRRNGTIGHSGGDPGVTAFVVFDPKTGTGRLFMTNVDVQGDDARTAQFAEIWSTLEAYERRLG